jgi:hypothetical protein
MDKRRKYRRDFLYVGYLSERREICDACKHYYPVENDPGFCTRYPDWGDVEVVWDDWCGEWEAKE